MDFFEYMMGTLIGFFPGTLAYVYGGTVSLWTLLAYRCVGGGSSVRSGARRMVWYNREPFRYRCSRPSGVCCKKYRV